MTALIKICTHKGPAAPTTIVIWDPLYWASSSRLLGDVLFVEREPDLKCRPRAMRRLQHRSQSFIVPKIPSDIVDDVVRSGQVHPVRTFPLTTALSPRDSTVSDFAL
jgi:hypothetical protein